MSRLPLRRAAATALALHALACERVETKSFLTDLDRLDDVESADADPDELAADTFEPEPDTADRIDNEPDTIDVVADADDTPDIIDAPDLPEEPEPDEIITDHDDDEESDDGQEDNIEPDTIEPDIADTADQDHLTDDDEESDALPPGCRDDQPVFGCPCEGTTAQRKWGNEICDPRAPPGIFVGTFCSGVWRALNTHEDAPDCQKGRCIDYAREPFIQSGLPAGWPCYSNDWMQGPDPACRDQPCICNGTGRCIPRDEYEGDADLDINTEGDYDGAVEFIDFLIPRR